MISWGGKRRWGCVSSNHFRFGREYLFRSHFFVFCSSKGNIPYWNLTVSRIMLNPSGTWEGMYSRTWRVITMLRRVVEYLPKAPSCVCPLTPVPDIRFLVKKAIGWEWVIPWWL